LLIADNAAAPSPEDDAAIADLPANAMAGADEDSDDPAAGALVAEAALPSLPDGPKVPNFHGKSMRAVVEEASEKGLSVLLDGSGVARMQQPPPGSVLHPGERIRVQFAR
jgi:cell division protein FtsI (penicillin-binding protein 3)